ncbi:MAG: HIT family protein [Acidimicrobiales bacterium]
MASVFTMIINGELPGHFVWRDERAVAFMSINPICAGHTLVVPVQETDHWTDLPEDLNRYLMTVCQKIGRIQETVFAPQRVGLIIAGFDVPHVHIHVLPINGMADMDFANAPAQADHSELAATAHRIRTALAEAGHTEAHDIA